MDESSVLKESFQLISKDFGLVEDKLTDDGLVSYEWLRKVLIARIQYLLDHDFNQLLNAMYRIDIPEDKVAAILAQRDHKRMVYDLADLVIEREKEKAVTRLKYRSI